jgi:two-component system sensor histidine kinase UhpB
VSLRLKLNLILLTLMAAFLATLMVLEIDAARRGVREEIESANRVATQVLQRVVWVYAREGVTSLKAFLDRLGRVRANELTLLDGDGNVTYRSPPSEYKKGRDAPAWFAALVVPPVAVQELPLSTGKLLVEADASRSVLDGWDDLVLLAQVGGGLFLIANLLVFWVLRRTLRALPVIEQGLKRLAAGEWSARLPPLPERETAAIGEAFNRMAEAVEETRRAERRAVEAEARLAASRELTRAVEHRLEQERAEIARELHDELGQAVTAIRSLAVSIGHRCGSQDAESADAAKLIAETAGQLYDAMHGLIPRLRPLTLDSLGLADALRDLAEQWTSRHPQIAVRLELGELPESAGPTMKLAVYRMVQEALANAVVHGQPSLLEIEAGRRGDALEVCVRDNGSGLPPDWDRPGRFGLKGMRERIEALGGTLRVAGRAERGVEVIARIPLQEKS